LDIWEAISSHSSLNPIASFDIPVGARHSRVVTGDEDLFLHFLVKDSQDRGSYLSVYHDKVMKPQRFSQKSGGTELVYLPASDRLGFYYAELDNLGEFGGLVRCWVKFH